MGGLMSVLVGDVGRRSGQRVVPWYARARCRRKCIRCLEKNLAILQVLGRCMIGNGGKVNKALMLSQQVMRFDVSQQNALLVLRNGIVDIKGHRNEYNSRWSLESSFNCNFGRSCRRAV